jgi:hypothetical protein
LTQRYFYESFDGYDSFIVAVYEYAWEQLRDELFRNGHGVVDERELVRIAIRTWVDVIVNRPAIARTILQAPHAEPVLRKSAQKQMRDAVGIVVRSMTTIVDPLERSIAASAVYGSLTMCFIHYLDGEIRATPEQLEDHCIAVITRLLVPADDDPRPRTDNTR